MWNTDQIINKKNLCMGVSEKWETISFIENKLLCTIVLCTLSWGEYVLFIVK